MFTTEKGPVRAAPGKSAPSQDSFVSIRGARIDPPTLLNEQLLDPDRIKALAQPFAEAQPSLHVVIEGLLKPTLLALIHEEFDLIDQGQWRLVTDDALGTRMGQATVRFVADRFSLADCTRALERYYTRLAARTAG